MSEAEGLDVERLAEALRSYHSTLVQEGKRLTWGRPDPDDAPAIAAEYARLQEQDR